MVRFVIFWRYNGMMMRAENHDHEHTDAEGAGGRLTPGRRAVLDLLERARRPVGAYELIDLLAAPAGRRPAPTQVYRALDFLVEQGLVHRLASRNAFLACGHTHAAAEPVAFLICDGCGCVEEATSSSLASDVADVAAAKGFRPRAQIIEIAGRCAACAEVE